VDVLANKKTSSPLAYLMLVLHPVTALTEVSRNEDCNEVKYIQGIILNVQLKNYNSIYFPKYER